MALNLRLHTRGLRAAEPKAAENHYRRLAAGRAESIETSAIHLDVIRDLKRINSHLTAVAYPILEQTGELSATRLRAAAEAKARSNQATGGQAKPA